MAGVTTVNIQPSAPSVEVAGEALLRPLRGDLRRWAGADASVSLADTDRAYASLPKYARARYMVVDGALWAAPARCVYRRDETTAWALLQLLRRYPQLPNFDVVLNCRDGPLLRRARRAGRGARRGARRDMRGSPLVLAYSTTSEHEELAFPDYTLWGLPGKLKPWAQLRQDLLPPLRRDLLDMPDLRREARPWAAKRPELFASGVVNAYHNSLG